MGFGQEVAYFFDLDHSHMRNFCLEFENLRECRVELLLFDDETQPNDDEVVSQDEKDDVILDIANEDDKSSNQFNSVFQPGFTSTQQEC